MNEDTPLIRTSIVVVLDAMLIIVLGSLFLLDNIVNGLLYNYGLVFSLTWAEAYWLMMKASMGLVFVVILILSILPLYPLLRNARSKPK